MDMKNTNTFEKDTENILNVISKACRVPVRFLKTPELGTTDLRKKYRISLRRAIIEGMMGI